MRAVVVERFGEPEVLVLADVPDPVPGSDQVVVDVSAADTIFVETTIRRGEAGEYFDINPPYVPGGAVAGRVSAVGDRVDTDWIGKQVATLTGGSGGYADRVVAAVDGLVAVPDGLSLTAAAALQHDGLTALALTEPAPLRFDRWVLVTAAAGGMGVLLVQLARASGARVIGAARGRRKLDLVSSFGAELAVDYSHAGWVEQVRQATGGGVDVVFDGAGGDIGQAAFDLTRPGGWFSGHGAPNGGFATVDTDQAARCGVTVRGIQDVWLDAVQQRRLRDKALRLAVDGKLMPHIGQTYPLDRAADAHSAIESRAVLGKTLLLV
jgi:NADPH:quinone reductase